MIPPTIRTIGHVENGYTLIEMLVVLLLLSFIALAVGSGIHFGTRVWEDTESEVQASNRIDGAQSLMRNLLVSATPIAKGEDVDFEGDPTQVAFVAPAPRALPSGGLVHVEISTASNREGTDIHIAFRNASTRREISLHAEVQSLRLAYLDASELEPVWLDRWHDRKNLPDAIRIEAVDDASRQAWPEFIVRLAISQKPHCAFDPISLDCRNA